MCCLSKRQNIGCRMIRTIGMECLIVNRNVIEIDECLRFDANESAARSVDCDNGMTERTVVFCHVLHHSGPAQIHMDACC